jgi:hypothetical protein
VPHIYIKKGMKQGTVKITDEQVKLAYEKYDTLHQAASELNVTIVTLWRKAKKIGLSWKDKVDRSTNSTKIPLIEILEGKHPYYQTLKLKKRLIKEGVKENKCDVCGITEWMNAPLEMRLDHLDGNSHNHLLCNLRMICPNCDAQTDTYCGRHKDISFV